MSQLSELVNPLPGSRPHVPGFKKVPVTYLNGIGVQASTAVAVQHPEADSIKVRTLSVTACASATHSYESASAQLLSCAAPTSPSSVSSPSPSLGSLETRPQSSQEPVPISYPPKMSSPPAQQLQRLQFKTPDPDRQMPDLPSYERVSAPAELQGEVSTSTDGSDVPDSPSVLHDSDASEDVTAPIPAEEASETAAAVPKGRKRGMAHPVKKTAGKRRKVTKLTAANVAAVTSVSRPATLPLCRGPRLVVESTPSEIERADHVVDDGLDDHEKLWCVCLKRDDGRIMVGCDGGCDNWFHFSCMGIDEADEALVDKFICKFLHMALFGVIVVSIPSWPATDAAT